MHPTSVLRGLRLCCGDPVFAAGMRLLWARGVRICGRPALPSPLVQAVADAATASRAPSIAAAAAVAGRDQGGQGAAAGLQKAVAVAPNRPPGFVSGERARAAPRAFPVGPLAGGPTSPIDPQINSGMAAIGASRQFPRAVLGAARFIPRAALVAGLGGAVSQPRPGPPTGAVLSPVPLPTAAVRVVPSSVPPASMPHGLAVGQGFGMTDQDSQAALLLRNPHSVPTQAAPVPVGVASSPPRWHGSSLAASSELAGSSAVPLPRGLVMAGPLGATSVGTASQAPAGSGLVATGSGSRGGDVWLAGAGGEPSAPVTASRVCDEGVGQRLDTAAHLAAARAHGLAARATGMAARGPESPRGLGQASAPAAATTAAAGAAVPGVAFTPSRAVATSIPGWLLCPSQREVERVLDVLEPVPLPVLGTRNHDSRFLSVVSGAAGPTRLDMPAQLAIRLLRETYCGPSATLDDFGRTTSERLNSMRAPVASDCMLPSGGAGEVLANTAEVQGGGASIRPPSSSGQSAVSVPTAHAAGRPQVTAGPVVPHRDVGQFIVPVPFAEPGSLSADDLYLGLGSGPKYGWPDEPEVPWRPAVPFLERHLFLSAAGAIVPRFAVGASCPWLLVLGCLVTNRGRG
jgi:hypothetical protein